MRITYQISAYIILALFFANAASAQNAMKSEKQSTKFFYTQFNLNGGFMLDEENSKFQFSESSPYSNINFTFKSKSQRLLQKGYTKFLDVSDFKASFAFVYKDLTDDTGLSTPQVGIQVRDLWVKVNTKWDRTSLKIGNFTLPYGHTPRIDLDNSFVPTLAGQDLGFSRDFGVLFKTPLTSNLDLEASLTMGGSLPSTLMTYDFETNSENPSDNFTYASFDYNNNWLATVRVGNPVFNKNEFGYFVSLGKVNGTSETDEQSYIYRLGGDWTYKHREQFKITNQLVTGYTKTESGSAGINVLQKSEVEYFLMRKFVLSLSNTLQYDDYTGTSSFKGTAVAGIGYAINPHTRLKINAYSKYNMTENSNQPGVFLQFVTGLGRRD